MPALFWYKFIFMAELLLAESLFTYKLKRRSHFFFRLPLAATACFGAAAAYPVLMYNAWYASIMFITLFSFSVLCLKFCYNESWINVFFCGILSYTVQHLAYLLYNLSVVSFNLVDAGALGTYLEKAEVNYNAYTAIAYGVCYYTVYWLSYLFCGTRIKRHQNLSLGSAGLLFLASVILLVDIVFNVVVVYHSEYNYDKIYLMMSYFAAIVSCILVLAIQFNLVDKTKLKREMDAVQLLRHQEHEQYALSKENIEIINVKCHDLKHKISSFRGRLDEKEIDEMESAVMIYDATVKTGNEVLDTILTEKSLKCGKNEVQLTCTADNSDLSFMTISDLYSLFGNVVENAIEAVMKIEDKKKRIICLNIKSTEKLLSVHLENYFSGEVTFSDGLPQTKKDARFHGFGMKSVRMITEKYGGNMLARTEGELFKMDILIPISRHVQ